MHTQLKKYRGTRLMLAFATFFAATGAPVALRAADAKAAGEDRAAIVARLEKLNASVTAALRETARDTFDPQAVVETVGRDPARLFEWVRDNTYLVPYAGSLRGASGVLMDRLGNSLDRSLLLAELFRSSGAEVRLARATLTEEQAKTLLAAARPAPAERLPKRGELDAARAEAYAKKHGLDVAAVLARVETVKKEEAALAGEVASRLAKQFGPITAAVGAGAGQSDEEAARVAALRDHFWLQRNENGTWVDLDVSRPDAAPGKVAVDAVAAAKTIALDAADLARHVPADAVHEIEVRVVVEQALKGQLKEQVVLKHAMRPAELIGRSVELSNVPITGTGLPNPLNTKPAEQPTKYKAAVLTHAQWLPTLALGKHRVSQRSFRDDGELNDSPKMENAAKIGNAAGGIMGGFSGGLTGDTGQAAERGVLTGEFLEYEFRSPGRKPVTVRRTVYDAIGPAARVAKKVPATVTGKWTDAQKLDRGLTLLGRVEMLPLVCELSPASIEHAFARAVANNSRTALAMAKDGDVRKRTDVAAKIEQLDALPGELHTAALFRHALSPQKANLFVDRPNLFTQISRPGFDAGGQLVEVRVFDVVANELAVLPGAKVDGFKARLEQGIIDTIAEDLALNGATPATADARTKSMANAARLFNAAGALDLATVRSADDAAYRAMALEADVRARIDATLAGGYAVVLPKQAITAEGAARVGWYRVDPATGTSLGVADNGYHAAMTQRAQAEAMIQSTFGTSRVTLSMVANASEYEIYQWMVMVGGHTNTLLRACAILKSAAMAANALL
ncbi:MAG TPA: hypothetical protein VK986_16570 [Tepidisphaeraceae bacterium]|nr:hypothetical protein [Tepidisphaeraceae bacterium]